MRVGIGHDTHRLEPGRPLLLGGVRVEHPRGLAGHSDADVVLHRCHRRMPCSATPLASARTSATLTPTTDPRLRRFDSRPLPHVKRSHRLSATRAAGQVVNLDVIVFAQEPKLGPVKAAICASLAGLLGLAVGDVNVKAKTGERVGHIGRAEAMACQAVVLIENN